MSRNFEKIKEQFDSGNLVAQNVLSLVGTGEENITFDEYIMITDKDYKEPKPKKKPEEMNPRLYYSIDTVRTDRCMGPRGDYYDWCRLLTNHTLEFGDEQGNYCGGSTLSYCFYGDPRQEYPYTHSVTKEYWDAVRRKLKYEKTHNYSYYSKIIEMCQTHNETGILDNISEVLEENHE